MAWVHVAARLPPPVMPSLLPEPVRPAVKERPKSPSIFIVSVWVDDNVCVSGTLESESFVVCTAPIGVNDVFTLVMCVRHCDQGLQTGFGLEALGLIGPAFSMCQMSTFSVDASACAAAATVATVATGVAAANVARVRLMVVMVPTSCRGVEVRGGPIRGRRRR